MDITDFLRQVTCNQTQFWSFAIDRGFAGGVPESLAEEASMDVDERGSCAVLTCIRDLFTCKPTALGPEDFERALTRLQIPDSESNIVIVPPHVDVSDAVSRGLLPIPQQSNYTASERMFLDMGTRLNWPQEQAHDVLAVLRDPRFHLEDLHPDLLRQSDTVD